MIKVRLAVAVLLCFSGLPVFAQQNGAKPPVDAESSNLVAGHDQLVLLSSARSRYYNLIARGARSFHCDVSIDWNTFFSSATGAPLAQSDPLLIYLNAVHVHFYGALTSNPVVQWEGKGIVPAGKEEAVNTLRQSYTGMIEGFLRLWAPSLSGNLVSLKVQSVKVLPGGYVIERVDGKNRDEVSLDKSFTATHLSSVTPEMASESDVSFTNYPEGLLMTGMDLTYHEPPDAPPIRYIVTTMFAPAGRFQLPDSLKITFPNAGTFKMMFTSCGVETQ